MPGLRVASDYAQLAFHALAHYPIAGPACLYDARYLAWRQDALPRAAWASIAEDAALVAGVHDAGDGAMRLQWLPALYARIAELRAGIRRELETLRPEEVASPSALAALRREDPVLVELVRGAMALAAVAYEASWPRARCEVGCATLAPALEEARALSPALAAAEVEVVWALGARGRVLEGRLFVGVPDDWSGLAREVPAVLALHEASVRAAGGDYVSAEWGALTEVARLVRQGSAPLRAAHAGWLARLSLEGLCRAAAMRGLVDPQLALRIAEEQEGRAALLGGA